MRNLTVVIIVIIINFVAAQFGSLQLGGGQQPNVNSGSRGQDFVFPDFYFPGSRPQSSQNNFGQQTQYPSYPQTTSSQRPDRPFKPSPQFAPSRLDERISESKCEEYTKLIEKKVQVSSLSLDSITQDLSVDQCDISTGLVVGGVKANENEFPHMAAIGYANLNQEITFACGASLISERFLLTAAHCARNGQFPAAVVRMGVLNIAASRGQLLASDLPIENFVRHENYNSRSKENDIAVIKLKSSVSFGDPQKIRPACLWQTERIPQSKVIATGWGHTQYAGSISDDLMKVLLDLLDLNQCVTAFEDDDNILITRNKVCAGVLAGGHDTCQGDSGGPIQISLPDSKCISYVVGITSFGGYCGGKNSPSVYTRVSSYLDWIESKVWG